jgi:hypothetical protein
VKRFQRAKNWFFAAVAVVFLLLAASSYFTYAAFSQLKLTEHCALKDSLVLQTVRQLFSELQDAETGIAAISWRKTQPISLHLESRIRFRPAAAAYKRSPKTSLA